MSKKRAFTMVELIFVIVILGILAAVAVPKLNASRQDAQIAAFKANLATLMNDIRSYYAAMGTTHNIITIPPAKEVCEDPKNGVSPMYRPEFKDGKCYVVDLKDNTHGVQHATNVPLDQGTALMLGDNPCLLFDHFTKENEEAHSRFMVYALTKKEDTNSEQALCRRALADETVQKLLTNQDGKIVGIDRNDIDYINYEKCGNTVLPCPLLFDLAAGGGVNFD